MLFGKKSLQTLEEDPKSWVPQDAIWRSPWILVEASRGVFDHGECESELVAGVQSEWSSMGFGAITILEYGLFWSFSNFKIQYIFENKSWLILVLIF